MIFLDGLAHHVGGFGRGGRLLFAGGGLDEVGAGIHGQDGGFLYVGGCLQGSGFENHLQVLFFAGGFQFLYLVAHGFVVSGKELAHRNHDVYLVGAFHHGHCCFGHLYFDESLRGGETARYAGNVYVLHFQRVPYDFGEVGIYADGGHVLQVGEFVVELIHFLGEFHDAFIAVLGSERSQVDAVEEEFLHVGRIVCRHFLCNDFGYLCSYFCIVHPGVILGQSGFVLVLRRLSFFHGLSVLGY